MRASHEVLRRCSQTSRSPQQLAQDCSNNGLDRFWNPEGRSKTICAWQAFENVKQCLLFKVPTRRVLLLAPAACGADYAITGITTIDPLACDTWLACNVSSASAAHEVCDAAAASNKVRGACGARWLDALHLGPALTCVHRGVGRHRRVQWHVRTRGWLWFWSWCFGRRWRLGWCFSPC